MGQNFCKVGVTVTNPGDLTPNEIQEYANAFRECTLRQYRQVCWAGSSRDETPDIPWCRSPLNREYLSLPKKYGAPIDLDFGERVCDELSNHGYMCRKHVNLPAARPCGSAYGAGNAAAAGDVADNSFAAGSMGQYCRFDYPSEISEECANIKTINLKTGKILMFEDCRFKQDEFLEYTMALSRHSIAKFIPDHEDISEGMWVEAMMSCHVPPAGSNDDRPFCRHYLRSEYLTLVEEYSINAEDFTGMFELTTRTHQDTPTHTHQERHAFAILAVATAKDVQWQQQEDPQGDDDTERTNAVLARAEAALACTQMWEDANHGTFFDMATARTVCPAIFPTPNCDDSESAVYKSKTCAWITKKNDPSNQKKKCKKSSGLGTVYDLCPSTCSKVDLGPCRQLN